MNDQLLGLIINEITKKIPVESIVLIGSRANNSASENSDYDLVTIIKTPLVPLYFNSLKRISSTLSYKHKIDIEINPLPMFIAQRAKGNLFLIKLCNEGKLIYGKDYHKFINPGNPNDILIDWYFSILASLMRKLLVPYIPFSRDKDLSRTIMRVGETLMEFGQLVEGKISNSIRVHAINILENTSSNSKSWLNARDACLNLFKIYMYSLTDYHCSNINGYVENYMRINKGKNVLKNFEYMMLSLLIKREIPPIRAIFSRLLIQDRIRASLIMLLASVNEEGIDDPLLWKSYSLINNCFKIDPSDNILFLWKNVKDAILSNWSYAHTVMGV